MNVILGLERTRQENGEYEANLGYIGCISLAWTT